MECKLPCRVVENGTFDAFWDTISFGFNGLVFFFAGASATNFAWRSTQVSQGRRLAAVHSADVELCLLPLTARPSQHVKTSPSHQKSALVHLTARSLFCRSCMRMMGILKPSLQPFGGCLSYI